MYATCQCPHVTQLPVQAATNTHPLRRVQFPRLQQAVSQQLIHDKHLKDIIGSCIRALAWRSYQSAKTLSHCWSPFSTFLPAESQGIRTWLTQWQCNLTCTDQWRFLLTL